MARPRTPSQLHEITGAYRRNPQRRNTNEPTPKAGIGPAPKRPSTNWRKCWDEIVDHVCPGVLGDSDRLWLERAARLLAESRSNSDRWSGAKETALQTYLSKLGMNPSDRSKVGAQPDPEDDPADKYFS